MMNQSDLIKQLQEKSRRLRARFTVPIVCICGSTRFKGDLIQANFQLTMEGKIVLTVGWFGHADEKIYKLTPEEKLQVDELHKRKIDLCDEIFVVNVNGYIGKSTRSEIDYAKSLDKPITYLVSVSTLELAIDRSKKINPTHIASRDDHHRIDSPGLDQMEDKDYDLDDFD